MAPIIGTYLLRKKWENKHVVGNIDFRRRGLVELDDGSLGQSSEGVEEGLNLAVGNNLGVEYEAHGEQDDAMFRSINPVLDIL